MATTFNTRYSQYPELVSLNFLDRIVRNRSLDTRNNGGERAV